jgi:predicted aspartyl protease
LNGTIAGRSATVLVDCGATGQFVSSSFVSRHGLPLAKVGSNSRITLADGRSSEADGVLLSVPVTLSSYTESLDFTVTTLRGYDAILGMEWLRQPFVLSLPLQLRHIVYQWSHAPSQFDTARSA